MRSSIKIWNWLTPRRIQMLSRFVVVGGLATLVDLGLLYLLYEHFSWFYLWAATVSFIAGMITNYTLNKIFTFENRSRQIARQFLLFAGVALVGLALNNGIIFLLHEYAHIRVLIAKIISAAIVMGWSLIGHRTLTFGKYR